MIANARRVVLVFAAGFLLVSGGLVYWQVIRSDTLATTAGNPRASQIARLAGRGRILDRNGTVLAQSVTGADGAPARRYGDPSLAQTIGYISDRFGVSGLEAGENSYLSGEQVADPAAQALNDLLHRQSPGDDVVLTIDDRLQKVAAAALGNQPGAVVALDPRTGAILALVSAPTYDPNQIDQLGDTLTGDQSRPLLNRATQGLYPPGSVYKMVTASAALDSGVVKPTDVYQCINGVVIQGFVIGCENAPAGQTQWDFKTAFAYSINATFAQVAEQIGSDRFIAYSRRFGMDEPPHLEIDAATSTTSNAGGSLDPILLANSGFGQGQLQVTPLQIALTAATIANGGVQPKPYLVQEIRQPDGTVMQQHSMAQGTQVIGAATAQEMTQFMLAAVGEFGQAAGLNGLDVAGKTGTAETGGTAAADSWFAGFEPSGSAGIVVAVIVEHGGAGSTAAGPIAAKVFQAFLNR